MARATVGLVEWVVISIIEISLIVNSDFSNLGGKFMLVSRIEELMKQSGIKTYAEFERYCGLANGTVGKWKNSSYKPSIDYLIKISDYFDVSIDYLIGRSDKPDRL